MAYMKKRTPRTAGVGAVSGGIKGHTGTQKSFARVSKPIQASSGRGNMIVPTVPKKPTRKY